MAKLVGSSQMAPATSHAPGVSKVTVHSTVTLWPAAAVTEGAAQQVTDVAEEGMDLEQPLGIARAQPPARSHPSSHAGSCTSPHSGQRAPGSGIEGQGQFRDHPVSHQAARFGQAQDLAHLTIG